MATNTLKKKRFMFALVALFIVGITGGLLTYWHRVYYVPMRRAKPIISLLNPHSSEDMQQALWLLLGMRYNPELKRYVEDGSLEPVHGIAAEKIKERTLQILASHTETSDEGMKTLDCALRIVVESSNFNLTGLEFRDDSDWSVIREAAAFYDKHDADYRRDYVVTRTDDGKNVLTIRHTMD